jgi:hypothetical protein
MKLSLLFRRRWWLLYIPILVIAASLLWLSMTVWLPLPPTQLTIAGGNTQGGYTAIALQYRQSLEQRGIQMQLRSTEGESGPLRAVMSTDALTQADAGFGCGLLRQGELTSVHSLGAIERQPVWIFTRVPGLNTLSQLRNMKIGVPDGENPSGSVLKFLFNHYQIDDRNVQTMRKPAAELANQLLDSQLDAVVIVDSEGSDLVRLLMRSPGVQIVGLDRVGSIQARDARLKPFILPQGAIELRGDIPSRDLTLVASHLNLLVKSDMHPALQRALLDAAVEVHETPSFLRRQGEFPNLRDLDYLPSPQLRAYSHGERPWMELVLPYWWAQLAQLILYAVLPILLVTSFLLAWIPSLFEWRVNAVLQNFYGELKFLETDIESTVSSKPIEIKRLVQKLDTLEQQVVGLDLPNQYVGRWYTLRSHLAFARTRLMDMRAR